jgi:aromatic-L-amino-acid decarboxylase
VPREDRGRRRGHASRGGDVVAGGEIFIGATAWEGLLAVRLSVCNWAMQLEDVKVAAAAILRSVDKVRAG